jgi:hypothetical protein
MNLGGTEERLFSPQHESNLDLCGRREPFFNIHQFEVIGKKEKVSSKIMMVLLMHYEKSSKKF